MSCTCDERTHAHDLAAILANCEAILGVDVLAPSVGPHTGWTIEATLTRRTVPHTILRVLDSIMLFLKSWVRRGSQNGLR